MLDEVLLLAPTGHSQKLLSYQGISIKIDSDLAPAMKRLWANNIKTDECCQGDTVDGPQKNNAYCVFTDSISARAFHLRMNPTDYLSQVRGKWSLNPKTGSRLLIALDWCPSKTDLLVRLICLAFSD